ncbi:MAG: phosphatase PAP2 family protein, partial [Gammaproteobacteria bacterium]|nr:phosphatase PAP2 family protein [Gammaproteobacteria bacterium]
FLFYGMYVKDESPRSSTFIWGLGLFFWCGLANMIMTNSIQSTPFPPIDPWLLKMDRLMGFSSSALMTWTHNHPHCRQIFNIAYAGLLFELLGIPILLTLFNGRKALSIFYIAQLSTMIIGSLIYFFFPTMAPSAVVHSPYFMHAEHDTSLRFYQIHHFLKVTSNDGGLIAFPSFHVLWAVLLTNTCRGEKRIFYPLACFNFILIISTVFLGWHYLSDVISGALLGVVGIYFGEWVYYRSESHTRLKQ